MVVTIQAILNQWAQMGVFSYVLPWLLIFAVVYAIIAKSEILGQNNAINVIVAASVGLMALQFDFVSGFFATIFPKFGIGLAVLLVIMVFIGMFPGANDHKHDKYWFVLGIILAVVVIWWALSEWGYLGGTGYNLVWWIEEYLWSLIVGVGVVGLVVWVINGAKKKGP